MKCFLLPTTLSLLLTNVFALSIIASTRSVVGVPSLVVWTREPGTDGTDALSFDLRFVQVDPEQDVGLALANIQMDAGVNVGTGMVTFPAAGGFTLKAVAGPRNTLIGTSNAVLAVVLNDPATSSSIPSSTVPPATSSTALPTTPTATDGSSSSASSTVLPSSASSSPSSTRLPSDKLATSNRPNVPAIVGGVVGAILFLSLLAILLVFLHRRRKSIKKRLTFHRDMMVQRRLSRHPPPASAPPSMTQLVSPPTMIQVTRPSGESARTTTTMNANGNGHEENPFEPSVAGSPKSVNTMESGVTSESQYSTTSSSTNAHGHTAPVAMPMPISAGGPLVPVRPSPRRTPSPPPILPPIQAHAASFSISGSSSSHSHSQSHSTSHSHAHSAISSSNIDLEQGLSSPTSPYPDVPTDITSSSLDSNVDLEASIARPAPVPSSFLTSPRGPRPSIRRVAPVPPIPPTPTSPPPFVPSSAVPLPPSAPPSAPAHSHSYSAAVTTITTTTGPRHPSLQPVRALTPRQQTLKARISMLQAQMRDMHERSNSNASLSSTSAPSGQGQGSTRNVLVEMQREMVWLREQENGLWALGETDVLPPGHARYMTP